MILTLFESVNRAYTRPEHVVNWSWPEVANFLMTHNPAKCKEDVWLFNLWEFKQDGELGRTRIREKGQPTEKFKDIPGTIRRCKANAVRVFGIALDFDGGECISEVETLYKDFEYVLYSTFRNTLDCNKMRIVFPFKSGVELNEFQKKKKSICETFQKVDHASFSETQAFYLHSGPVPYTKWNKGAFLDPNWFEDEIEKEKPVIKIQGSYSGDNDFYKEALIDSLATCSGLHYANERSKLGVLTLVAMCKSAKLTYDEYNALCWNMAAQDSSLQNENQRKMAWVSWTPHSGITKEIREEFISTYGGKSKFTQKVPSQLKRTAQEIREYVLKTYGNQNNGK